MLDLLMNACEHLELIPLDKDKEDIKSYLWEVKQPDTSTEDMEEYIGELIERAYAPYCKLRECPCVVLESPVLSQSIYGFSNFHQPLNMTFANRNEITDCPDRNFLKGNPEGIELLETFLLTHINAD